MDVIKSQKSTFPRPTAIQRFCWPVLLTGRDIILVNNSGYGKKSAVEFFFSIVTNYEYNKFLVHIAHSNAHQKPN